MAAAPTPLPDLLADVLKTLGEQLRARRESLKVSAVAVAEVTGLSCGTLRRIERGEASTSMGAYLQVAASLGLEVALVDRVVTPHRANAVTDNIRIADYPELRRLAWQLREDIELTPRETLNLIERNWRHVDQSALNTDERDLLRRLADTFGGRLLV